MRERARVYSTLSLQWFACFVAVREERCGHTKCRYRSGAVDFGMCAAVEETWSGKSCAGGAL
jgi:hypothetical protein